MERRTTNKSPAQRDLHMTTPGWICCSVLVAPERLSCPVCGARCPELLGDTFNVSRLGGICPVRQRNEDGDTRER